MKHFIAPALLASTLAFAPLAQAQDMTEAIAAAWLADMNQAAAAQNAQAVADLLAEDVQIASEVEMAGRREAVQYDKRTYLEAMNLSWSNSSDYEYRSENQVIRLAGKQATVTGDVIETMTIAGMRLASRTQETITLEMRDNKALATRVEGKSQVQMLTAHY